MKSVCLILCLTVIAVASAATFNQAQVFNKYYNQGSYRPTHSGAYRPANSGQYVHDNSGSYKNDDGKYRPDDSGKYIHQDNKYLHKDEKYQHQGDKFGNSGSNNNNKGGNGNYGQQNSGHTGQVIDGSQQQQQGQVSQQQHQTGNQYDTHRGPSGHGQTHEGAYGRYQNNNFKIIRKIENVEQDGYHYLYETENGILAEEQGKLHNKGTEQEAMKAHGFYTYTGPDNVVYTVKYTADENGFVPEGAHIPTPPPIPAAIIRALEYQRAVGTL